MNEDEFDQARKRYVNALQEKSVEALADLSGHWDGDGPNHRTARAIIGSTRPLLEAIHNGRDMDPAMLALAMQHFMHITQSLEMLIKLNNELKLSDQD